MACAQRAGGEGERVAATERAPARQDVREHRGERSLRRSRRQQQELLLRGRPQQTTHAQSVHPGDQVNGEHVLRNWVFTRSDRRTDRPVGRPITLKRRRYYILASRPH